MYSENRHFSCSSIQNKQFFILQFKILKFFALHYHYTTIKQFKYLRRNINGDEKKTRKEIRVIIDAFNCDQVAKKYNAVHISIRRRRPLPFIKSRIDVLISFRSPIFIPLIHQEINVKSK